jgi:hypothetical protein
MSRQEEESRYGVGWQPVTGRPSSPLEEWHNTNPLPSLLRKTARAGNGKVKEAKVEKNSQSKGAATEEWDSRRLFRIPAYSFMREDPETLRQAGLATEGHDPKSFASRVQRQQEKLLQPPSKPKSRDSIVSLVPIMEDLSFLEGNPFLSNPPSAKGTQAPEQLKGDRDSEVRLSKFYGDLGTLEGLPPSLQLKDPRTAPTLPPRLDTNRESTFGFSQLEGTPPLVHEQWKATAGKRQPGVSRFQEDRSGGL